MNTKKKIKTVVVDDEDLAREGLELMLKQFAIIDIVASCSDGIDAINKIHNLNPDVLFLDIQMPRVNGFEVLELLGKEAPATIFVTAYDEYAVKAFEANALDYLMKPINPERLKKSISKLSSRINPNLPAIKNVIDDQIAKQTDINRILVRDGNIVHVILVKDIVYFEAQDDYVAIKTEKAVFLKPARISRIEQQLSRQKFKRIHRSYIVNVDFLQRIEDQRFAVLKNGKKIPVSRSGYTRFFKD